MTWILFSTTLLTVAAAVFAASAITLDFINVPENAKVGDTVTLECPYSLNPVDSPHTVKWSRNRDQFYQFDSPNEKNSFHVDGIDVYLDSSDGRQVTLRLSSVASSGEYTCQVIVLKPYDSANRIRLMTVSEAGTTTQKPVTTTKRVETTTTIAPPKRAGASGMMGESLLHKVLLTLLVAASARLFGP